MEISSATRRGGRVVNRIINLVQKAWWSYGFIGALLVLVVIFVILYFIFVLPIELGLLPQGSSFIPAIISLVLTGSLGYTGKKQAEHRARVFDYANAPTPAKAANVVPLLEDPDEEVRAAAIFTIKKASEQAPGKVVQQYHGDASEIVNKLAELIEDDSSDARVEAIDAIVDYARDYPKETVKHDDKIVAATNFSSLGERVWASAALGNLGGHYPDRSERYLDAIEPVANSDDPEARKIIAGALAQIGSQRALRILEQLSRDPNPEVSQTADQYLESYRQQATNYQQEQERQSSKNDAQSEEQSSEGKQFEFIEDPPEMDFDDIAGMDDLKSRLQSSVIDPFISNESAYDKFGVGSESGILLHGPPGTGKTHIAKCLAGEIDANYAGIDVGDIESKFLGKGVENIKQLFDEARRRQPAVVFIDEIDALAAGRDSDSNMHEDKKKMVNQLLQEVSDINPEDDLIVIAATNRPNDVDDAMLRSGRFDSKIEIPRPDGQARWEIFQQQLTGPAVSVPQARFIRETSGFSASDIVEVARRAARKAAVREQEMDIDTQITENDVFEAVDQLSGEKSATGEFIRNPPEIDFSDVAGMEDLKETLRDKIIDPLENPSKYEKFGVGIERGFLLYGPPGTGKTYISKALAGELEINYIEAKAGDLVSKWIGEGAQNVQKMFDEASDNQPTLIFIDEIDALVSDRGSGNQQKSERQMVNQFLEEISTINDEEEDVIVIGATNMKNSVDEAILRSGRLGEQIEVPPPDADTRKALFEAHLEAPHETLDTQFVAEKTERFVASDMAQLADETARKAMKRHQKQGGPEQVTQSDVERALEQMIEKKQV